MKRDDAELLVLIRSGLRARAYRLQGMTWAQAEARALDEIAVGYQSSLTKAARQRIRRRLRARRPIGGHP